MTPSVSEYTLYRGPDYYYEVDEHTSHHNNIFSRAVIQAVCGECPERIKVFVLRKHDVATFTVEKLP